MYKIIIIKVITARVVYMHAVTIRTLLEFYSFILAKIIKTPLSLCKKLSLAGHYFLTLIEYTFFPLTLSSLLCLIVLGSYRARAATGNTDNPTIPSNLNVHLHSRTLLIAPDIHPKPPPSSIVKV